MIVQPELQYNPDLQSYISSRTKLGRGITMAKFLGSYSDKTDLSHMPTQDLRRKLARNLTLHANALSVINNNTQRFNDVRVIVSEGVYKKQAVDAESEIMTQKAIGRLVYYQVIGTNGEIDFEKTFDVAVFWKDHIEYDEIKLDYDNYNPDGSFSAQIGLLMPFLTSEYEANFLKEVNTYFNNELMADNAFTEFTG